MTPAQDGRGQTANTPWRQENGWPMIVNDANGYHVLTLDESDTALVEQIVEAVNNHAALLEALQRIVRAEDTAKQAEADDSDGTFFRAMHEYRESMQAARALLSELSKSGGP